MPISRWTRLITHPSGAIFLIAVAGTGLLATVPELWLWVKGYEDIKLFASIFYYEAIASAFFLAPALLLSRRFSQVWLVVMGTLIGTATLVAGFQAFAVGARWDLTAHAAVMETNSLEASGFAHAFISTTLGLALVAIVLAFVACIGVSVRAVQPRRSLAATVVALMLLGSSYGIVHIVHYGGNPIHRVPMSADTTLSLVEPGINAYHPILRLAATHWNFVATHEYRRKILNDVSRHLPELKGATPITGTRVPRIIVVVIGESASRRHWSIYGYHRATNPELAELGPQLLVYRDAICHTVGTLTEIQGMMCTDDSLLPIFALFSFVGYKTHWFSAQLDQGPNDVKMAAIIQSCQEKIFLNGAYDENLVPLAQRAIAEPGKQLIVINLFGSHVRYDDRYPERFAVFQGDDEKSRRLAAYDNSIRYTDHVLAQLIRALAHLHESACFLYLSDHAEDVYDSDPDHYLFRNDSVATNAMYEIPMVAWVSPEYREENPDFVKTMMAAENRPFQSLGLYHSLIDLARLRHPIFDSHRSLFSAEYVPHDRHVGVAERVYQPEGSLSSIERASTRR